MNTSLKTTCKNCGQHVEFPAEMTGQVVDCPGCKRPVLLQTPDVPAQSLLSALRPQPSSPTVAKTLANLRGSSNYQVLRETLRIVRVAVLIAFGVLLAVHMISVAGAEAGVPGWVLFCCGAGALLICAQVPFIFVFLDIADAQVERWKRL